MRKEKSLIYIDYIYIHRLYIYRFVNIFAILLYYSMMFYKFKLLKNRAGYFKHLKIRYFPNFFQQNDKSNIKLIK